MRIHKINLKIAVGVSVSICIMAFFFADGFLFFQSSGTQAVVFSPFQDNSNPYYSATSEEVEAYDIVLGDGDTAIMGSNLVVSYKGWFEDTETLFVSFEEEAPLAFTLGQGGVISGWDEGLVGMKEGGVRRLIIPPELGYGKLGLKDFSGKTLIPPNTALVFEVFLMSVSD